MDDSQLDPFHLYRSLEPEHHVVEEQEEVWEPTDEGEEEEIEDDWEPMDESDSEQEEIEDDCETSEERCKLNQKFLNELISSNVLPRIQFNKKERFEEYTKEEKKKIQKLVEKLL